MISQFSYRTGLPMVDLFFSSFATMLEMQRAFVSGGMMTTPVSAKFGHSDQSPPFRDRCDRGTGYPHPEGRAEGRQAAGSKCEGLPR